MTADGKSLTSNEMRKEHRDRLRKVGRDRMSTDAWQVVEMLLNQIDRLESQHHETRERPVGEWVCKGGTVHEVLPGYRCGCGELMTSVATQQEPIERDSLIATLVDISIAEDVSRAQRLAVAALNRWRSPQKAKGVES